MKIPENLPPLTVFRFLVPISKRPLLFLYLRWIQLLAVRGLKLKKAAPKDFDNLYRAVSRPGGKATLLGKLQQAFIKENLSLSLLLEPIEGFGWLNKQLYPLSFDVSSPLLLKIVAPFSRFIAALNRQHPPFYQPFSILCAAYLSLYIANMPPLSAALEKSKINFDKDNLADRLPLLLDEAAHIFAVVSGWRRRFSLAFYLGLCRRLMKKNTSGKINFFDYVNAILYSLWYIYPTKRRARNIYKL